MSYRITTSTHTALGRQDKQLIWEGKKPLGLGHPIRWVIEKTPDGARARPIRNTQHSLHKIPQSDLEAGTSISLQPELTLQILPIRKPAPLYTAPAKLLPSENQLTLFTCRGNTPLHSQVITSLFTETDGHTPLFTLQLNPPTCTLTLKHPQAHATEHSLSTALPQDGTNFTIPIRNLPNWNIEIGGKNWRFGLSAIHTEKKSKDNHDSDNDWFNQSLRIAAVGFAVLVVTSWLWPQSKTNPEELIPAQVAKIILNQTKPAPAKAESAAAQASTQQKVEKAAVVQAFRAKALQNSMHGLLKGGITHLLDQSQFVASMQHNTEANKIFASKSDAMKSSAPSATLQGARSVNVASVGGNTDPNGTGTGYGTGKHAAISGQGTSQVSLDLGNTQVADGLSKEEVGEVIHRHLSEVRYCYESAILRTPGVEGRLIVNFNIGKTGAVTSSEIKNSTLPDPRLDDCIIRRLSSWRFPQPKGGVDVAVSYPFIFKTLGR